MIQSVSNAYRIAAAEGAIARHLCEVQPDAERVSCTADDAADLLQSLALWAESNGVCLRIPKVIYEEIETTP